MRRSGDGERRPKTGDDDGGAMHVIADWSAMGHVIWRDVESVARMCECMTTATTMWFVCTYTKLAAAEPTAARRHIPYLCIILLSI